jgi:lambda family phage minor tail protein L
MTVLQGAVIQLFELAEPPGWTNVYRFSNTLNENGTDVVWNGQTYQTLPVEAEGFEFGGSKMPRPTLRISNIGQVVGALTRASDDLVGWRVTRRRTFAKFLDAVNFIAGNPNADPTAEIPPDIYYVERKTSENKLAIEWELAAALDLSGVMLPGRQIIANMCLWVFKGTECGYAGAEVSCTKTLQSCEALWPNVPIPFGGFPAAGLRRS